jgi:hypothetical protein
MDNAATPKSIFKTLGVPVKPQGVKALSDEALLEELKKRGLKVDYLSEEAGAIDEMPMQEDVPVSGIN